MNTALYILGMDHEKRHGMHALCVSAARAKKVPELECLKDMHIPFWMFMQATHFRGENIFLYL